jgi:CRP-like cAMP-binding protein
LLLGSRRADYTVLCQITGDALRIDSGRFAEHLQEPRLRDRLGQYASALTRIMAQSTACMAFHPIEQRLARWLLLVQDELEGNRFSLTQEYLAVMLGVHRPTVTVAIRTLEMAGLISHGRGFTEILNRPGLTEAACECYAAVNFGAQ